MTPKTSPDALTELANEPIDTLADRLIDSFRDYPSVVVAFSGGVDSAVVAYAASRALSERAVAITGVGEAVPQHDLDSARRVAKAIGISHVELRTNEIENADYVRNDGSRCFHCKTTLYSTLTEWAAANGFETIVSGTNLDDLGDYRPGLQAASDHAVVAPLAALKIDKSRVRALANYWNLEVADKPASPCLASRVAYGQRVTVEKLRSIEAFETALHDLGFVDVRVRVHAEGLVRIELDATQMQIALDPVVREKIVSHGRSLGFTFVTLDLSGRQSGSLNRLLPIIQ